MKKKREKWRTERGRESKNKSHITKWFSCVKEKKKLYIEVVAKCLPSVLT